MGQGLATPPDAPNRLIKDRYYLQKVKLGSGSFGTVWRAVDKRNDVVVAVKQVDKEHAHKHGAERAALEREINMIRSVAHENITRLIDTFEDCKSIFVILEYCDGGDFGDKVNERGMDIEESEVAHWVRQMCSAIAAMHAKGICHRDIKPDNFMVSGGSSLKLSDFGLAAPVPRDRLLADKLGTPAFMAPEIHHLPKRSSGYSYPVDMWAAGVSMYMVMFGGHHPWTVGRGELNESSMLQGALDFTERRPTILGFDIPGAGVQRFSEAARGLCQQMVSPNPARRISAVAALGSSWFGLARSPAPAMSSPRGAPSAIPAPSAPPPATKPSAPPPAMKRAVSVDAPERRRPAADGGTRLCRMGCGRPVAAGAARSGRPFDTCCKGCALGQGHDARCAPAEAKRRILPGS